MERHIYHKGRRYRVLVGREVPYDRAGLLECDLHSARLLMTSLWREPYARKVLGHLLRQEFNQHLLHHFEEHRVVDLLAGYLVSRRLCLIEEKVKYPDVGEPYIEKKKMAVPVIGPLSTWIEIALVDESGEPVCGEYYEIRRPDGTTLSSGRLDSTGLVRVGSIFAGKYLVSFSSMDERCWSEKKDTK